MDIRLRALLADAKEKGFIFYGALEGRAELDEVLAELESGGVEIVAELNAAPADEMPESPDDPVSIYLNELSHVAPVTRDEETALVARGDAGAKKRLMEGNLAGVTPIAGQYQVPGFPLLDLIQQGNTGLIAAVETFKPGRGYRLATYASFHVHSALQKFISTRQQKGPPTHLQ